MRQFTLRDYDSLTQSERDIMLDRLMDDLTNPPPPAPLCRFGQGDYASDYNPEPRAIAAVPWAGIALLTLFAALAVAGLFIGGVL